MPIRVLVADDHEVVRSAIKRMLARDARLEVVGTAADLAETFAMSKTLKPDILVIDVHMCDQRTPTPASTAAKLRLHTKRIVAMSIWANTEAKDLAAKLAADEFLDKTNLARELIPLILQLAQAESPADAASSGTQSR